MVNETKSSLLSMRLCRDYPSGKPVYCRDFLYENEFSIQEF